MCLSRCAGNATEFCGGGFSIDLYKTDDVEVDTNGDDHGLKGKSRPGGNSGMTFAALVLTT
jgi:hypothetical protein